MDIQVARLIKKMNPWLEQPHCPIVAEQVVNRVQYNRLMQSDWDKIWTVLIGPRRAGKTTLGKMLAQGLIHSKRYSSFLYLNCDFAEVREFIKTTLFIDDAINHFKLIKPIIFIDEIQRIENPGLLMKGLVDLDLKVKLIASGSSQLELKSKVQEFLTGRHFEAVILPMSFTELGGYDANTSIYGCYPEVIYGKEKQLLLKQLYEDYINKDIIEILKVGKPDVLRKLIVLIAHSSGQLVNYNQMASDCRVSIPTIQHYCEILEKTFTIAKITPFVGNKRKEIVSNPVYYFMDNGFRNQALRNLAPLGNRQDVGMLIENVVFQAIYKLKMQKFLDFDIHYWRTQSGAEVDFILYKNELAILPIEVKFKNMSRATVSRSLGSFIDAYQPKVVLVITKNLYADIQRNETKVEFVPLEAYEKWIEIVYKMVESDAA